MRVIRQGVPATAFYFILTEKNAAEVERSAWMDVLRFSKDIQTPTDYSLLFPAIALSGNRTLLEKLPDIIRTDERQRFNGSDSAVVFLCS